MSSFKVFTNLKKIFVVPRRIINPRCNADWSQNNWGGNNVDEYVEPNGINFYRIHPNYFFQPGGNRRVRIQGHGHSQISVCSSRWVERPRLVDILLIKMKMNLKKLSNIFF